MVKPPTLVDFSAAQNMALAMLGYYRWLPRAALTSHQAAKSNPAPPPTAPVAPKKAPPPTDNRVEKVISSPPAPKTREEKHFLVSLSQVEASVNITRDYTLLSTKYLPCIFLLPPLWTHDGHFQCFATPAEKSLWLNAWEAIDVLSVHAAFQAFFIAKIPLQIVPQLPLPEVLAEEKRALVCVGKMQNLDIPSDKVCFNLTHPWFLLQKPLQKKTFWLELLALKEKLF